MQALWFSAIPTAVAQNARERLADGYGHNLKIQINQSLGNPCRHCLRMAAPKQRIILLSYSPFAGHNPYSEVGPIFVCADDCARYADCGVFPPDFLSRPLVLRAYDDGHEIQDAALARAGAAETTAARLLRHPRAKYVHARHPTYGCYDFRIELAR